MTLTQALTLGVLQGATEFLPVSSSGHLALAEYFWPGGIASETLVFDVVVHLGTLAAIVIVLRRRVSGLVRAGVSLVPGTSIAATSRDRRWLGLLIIGSVPTAAIGLLLRDLVHGMHSEPALIGGCLWVTALLLVVSERSGSRQRGAADLRAGDALLIGIAQGLAVLPGISRSGATIATALLRDVDGRAAVDFSMLVSIPAILGANALELAKAGTDALRSEAAPLAVGFAAAFITGAFALRALQWAVQRRKLQPFAAYCAAAGAVAIGVGVLG